MLNNLGLAEASIVALLGYGVVFLGIVLLMCVVVIIGKSFSAAGKRTVKTAVVEEAPVEEISPEPAPGSAGKLKLYNVDPKTAAMLMAIVANKMGKPINELRFISIKEVN